MLAELVAPGDRGIADRDSFADGGQHGGLDGAVLDGGDDPRQRAAVAGGEPVDAVRGNVAVRAGFAARDHVVDHAAQAHGPAVLRRVDPGDAVRVQLPHLLGDDHPAAAAEHADRRAAALAEHVHHVPEVLDVAALVGAHRDRMGVLVERRDDDLLHRPVVPEVHHLGPRGLEDPAHDVDRGVVPVEQARRGDEADPGGVGAGLGGMRAGVRGAGVNGKGGLGHGLLQS